MLLPEQGITPHRHWSNKANSKTLYIIQARMQRAKKLLADTTLTVQEIADQCGYKTPTHFMRQFKERAGISATQYRKKYAKQCR